MKLKFCFVLTRWDDFFFSLVEIAGKPSHVTNAMKEPWESISNKHRPGLGRWSGSDRSRINSLKDSTTLISCWAVEFAADSLKFCSTTMNQCWASSAAIFRGSSIKCASNHRHRCHDWRNCVSCIDFSSAATIFSCEISKSISSGSIRPRSDLRRLDTQKSCVRVRFFLPWALISNRQLKLSDN